MNNNLSLMFLLKGVLNKIPFPFIQVLLNYSLKKMHAKYPRVFAKVAEKEETSFLIIPLDLPFNFYLIINKNYPSLTVEEKDCNLTPSATIKATLFNLLSMFEGKLDGDAAFFSKSLVIEGSTAAIVALRNAIDSENINVVKDLTEDFGIFKKVIRKIITLGISKYNNLNTAIEILQEELLQDCNNKIKHNSYEISNLKQEINQLRTTLLNN